MLMRRLPQARMYRGNPLTMMEPARCLRRGSLAMERLESGLIFRPVPKRMRPRPATAGLKPSARLRKFKAEAEMSRWKAEALARTSPTITMDILRRARKVLQELVPARPVPTSSS